MDNITSSKITANTHLYPNNTVKTARLQNDETVSPSEKNEQGITLTISTQSRENLATEKANNVGENIAKQMNKNAIDSTTEKEDVTKNPIDVIIEQLKEQISEISQKLEALQDDDSEVAAKQREALNTQLATLNGLLMEMITKKIAMLKKKK
jgi:vacuolar-type H+-ATPase subunit I/STV1